MLQNTIIFIILTIICYGCVVFAERFFGKAGLFGWIAIATIISNILAASVGPMLGLEGVTLANVPFATIFLSTQLLSVCYSEDDSKKGVNVGLFSAITFLSVMMLCSYLQPESYDSVTSQINYLFGFGSYNMCNTVASVLMFYLANLTNVYIFNKINNKLNGKCLWIANNVSTIISNCAENFAFVLLGLYLFPNLVLKLFPTAFDPSNLMNIHSCLVIAITTCICEILLAIVDTPILYLTKKIHDNKVLDK